MIQSGEGDWIIDSIPSGTESGALLVDLVHRKWGLLEGQNAFCLAGTSPPNEKPLLCVLCASVVKNLFWTRPFGDKTNRNFSSPELRTPGLKSRTPNLKLSASPGGIDTSDR
jgi:hypothetical protein